MARLLRADSYAALLALTLAKANVERFAGGLRVAVILAVTSRRSPVAPATLAIGTGAGIGLGVVMYAVAPPGLARHATNPWLAGSAADPLVVLAWIVLLGAPLGAGALAARRCRENGGPVPPGDTGILRQSTAAGLLSTLVGALFVTVAGPARSR